MEELRVQHLNERFDRIRKESKNNSAEFERRMKAVIDADKAHERIRRREQKRTSRKRMQTGPQPHRQEMSRI